MLNEPEINLNYIKFFIVAAESKSLYEAGDKLGYSASTLSTSISTLEGQLGVKLLTRNPLKTTEVGQKIYEALKEGIKNIQYAEAIAKSKNSMESGKISIGCPSHIVEFYLMEKIIKLTKDYPNIEIILDASSNIHQLIEKLKHNEIDFIIMDSIPEEYKEKVTIKKIKDIENIFVSQKEIKIEKIKDMENYKYIFNFKNKETTKKLMEKLDNVKLQTILTCSATEQRINAAKNGLGIAYIMKDAVQKDLEKGTLHEVKVPIEIPMNSINIIYLKDQLTKVDKNIIKTYIK